MNVAINILHTNYNGSFVIHIKPKTKYRFHEAAMLFYDAKNCLRNTLHAFRTCITIQYLWTVALVLFQPQKFA
jgi:hypothetical protein